MAAPPAAGAQRGADGRPRPRTPGPVVCRHGRSAFRPVIGDSLMRFAVRSVMVRTEGKGGLTWQTQPRMWPNTCKLWPSR
jgi:hypothetical protein